LTSSILCCLAAADVTAAAEPELKGTPTELQHFLRTSTHALTLVGHAKRTVEADVGHVTVIVHTQARELAAAITANGQRRDAFIRSVEHGGIDAKAIRAAKFASSPQFSWFGKTPSSYDIVNEITVDVADERQMIVVASAAAESADSSVGAITFEYSKQDELEEDVRRSAFDDALAKKSFYEQRLGATLKPTSFEFSDYSAHATPASSALEEVVVSGSRRNALASAAQSAMPAPPPSFGEKEYEVSANVSFEIETKTAAR
jgi:uncharacterized protein YggE